MDTYSTNNTGGALWMMPNCCCRVPRLADREISGKEHVDRVSRSDTDTPLSPTASRAARSSAKRSVMEVHAGGPVSRAPVSRAWLPGPQSGSEAGVCDGCCSSAVRGREKRVALRGRKRLPRLSSACATLDWLRRYAGAVRPFQCTRCCMHACRCQP